MRGAAQTVALYDINGAKVRAEALDVRLQDRDEQYWLFVGLGRTA